VQVLLNNHKNVVVKKKKTMNAEQFEKFMKQQQLLLQQQQEFMNTVLNNTSTSLSKTTTTVRSTSEKLMDTLSNSISTFIYDPENGLIFNEWYDRYEDVLIIDGKDLDDASKVRLLLRKLDESAHNRYSNYILPKKPRDNSLEITTKTLKEIFGWKISLFSTRFQCLNAATN